MGMKIATSLAALVLSTCGAFAQEEQVVQLEQCPPAVKAVIQENITRSRGSLEKIEKETKNGVARYDAKIIDGAGKRWALRVSPEGKVLEAKEKAKENPTDTKDKPKDNAKK
jgi:hypothetical protein